MPHRPFRNFGQRRRTGNDFGCILSRAVSTLLADHYRTVADLEKWVDEWKPPDPRGGPPRRPRDGLTPLRLIGGGAAARPPSSF